MRHAKQLTDDAVAQNLLQNPPWDSLKDDADTRKLLSMKDLHAQTLACAFERGLTWILHVDQRYMRHRAPGYQPLAQAVSHLFDEHFAIRDSN